MMKSRLVAELASAKYDGAAENLVELAGRDRVMAWDSLYCSHVMFRSEWLGKVVGEGTYTSHNPSMRELAQNGLRKVRGS